ncbi:MAG: 16S rRNA processing protein RimM [Candidatus Eisenbacteria bacterium]|uniref:Ribosome maturation factor RimM n=1 Tax=Eiseniibacteriota bacterium TaxID=2212470 RepID=A0A538UAV8_UNCEI|nr:MAG: 16S rRNA processing protein RimM [Candidatus Eisenbacteria bacterium]
MTTESVRIGQLGRAHGVHGEIALDGVSLTPEELEQLRSFTWRKSGVAERALVLEAVRPMHGRLLVRFSGFTQRERVAELTLGELWVERSKLPPPGPGEAYTFQLVGLRVVDSAGRELGVLREIMRTGAHPIWVVRGERELLVPAAAPIVRNVDLEAGVITVDLPPGLEQL